MIGRPLRTGGRPLRTGGNSLADQPVNLAQLQRTRREVSDFCWRFNMFKATGAFPRFKIVIEGVELQIENRRRRCKTSLSTTWHKHSFYTNLPSKVQASRLKKKKKPTVIGKSQPAWAGCDRKIAARSATALIGYGHGNG